MAFSHVRKAFCPIGSDLSKRTTDFIQQVQVQCVKTSVARNLSYQKYKNTCTFSNGSRIHEIWAFKKSIDDYIIEQQNKNTRAKTTRNVQLLIEFLREKHDQRNPEDIEAAELNEYLCEFILSVTRKDGKDFEPARLKVCFQVLIDIWKNAIIPSVSSKTLLLHALEAKNKQLMYRSLPKPPMPPPPGKTPGHVTFLKNFGQFPAILLVRRSNAPPAWASKRVKSPTLQAC